jgi:hypothetical protein
MRPGCGEPRPNTLPDWPCAARGFAARRLIVEKLTPHACRNAMLNLKAGGRVAQLVEQCPFKAWVAGSNPAALTIPHTL